jgi:RNA-directed DNA polymerase
VAGFEQGDARRFLDAMRERFEAFSLSLHPDKTGLIEFGRHAAVDLKKRGVGRPETFAFLGFTFICGKSRRGAFQLQRKTRRDRMRAKLQEIKAELRQAARQLPPNCKADPRQHYPGKPPPRVSAKWATSRHMQAQTR